MINSIQHTFIVYRLGKLHVSQADIARICNVSPAMVNYVIRGSKRSPRVQAVIASILGFADWNQLMAAAYHFQSILIMDAMGKEVAGA